MFGIRPVRFMKRWPKARVSSLRSQYQPSVRVRPCAALMPRPWTSDRVKSKAASFWPPSVMPYSAACLIEFEVSRPALASPITCAFDPCACNRNEEKSWPDRGWRTEPNTLPPLAFTTAVVSFSRAVPKA